MSAEPRPDGKGMRLRCDTPDCPRFYSSRGVVIFDEETLRKWAFRTGWRLSQAGGDQCRDCGGGKKAEPPYKPVHVVSKVTRWDRKEQTP